MIRQGLWLNTNGTMIETEKESEKDLNSTMKITKRKVTKNESRSIQRIVWGS